MARQSTDAGMPVLLTRSEAQSRAFAETLTAAFGARVRTVIAPLMRVDLLSPPVPEGPFEAVIFTSANGVQAARRLRPLLPDLAWCVGDKTAQAAQTAGFRARSAGGDAEALLAAVLTEPTTGRLVHLRGEETRGDISERLGSAGIETESIVVYRQAAQPLTEAGAAVLAQPGPVIVPLFSPQSARRLVNALTFPPRADLRLVVMSEAVARAADKLPRVGLWVAAHPDASAMLQAVAAALDTPAAP